MRIIFILCSKVKILWRSTYNEELTKRLQKEKQKARNAKTNELTKQHREEIKELEEKHDLEISCISADKEICASEIKKYKKSFTKVKNRERLLENKIKLLDKYLPFLKETSLERLRKETEYYKDELFIIDNLDSIITESKKVLE